MLKASELYDVYKLTSLLNNAPLSIYAEISPSVCEQLLMNVVSAGWVRAEHSANALNILMYYCSDKISFFALERAIETYELFDNQLGLSILESYLEHAKPFCVSGIKGNIVYLSNAVHA